MKVCQAFGVSMLLAAGGTQDEIIPEFALRSELDDAIQRNLGHRNIGTYLLLEGLISRSKLNDALDFASKTGVRLGKALVNRGYITQEQLFRTLAEQMSMPFYNLADIDLDITPHHFEIMRLLEEEEKLHVTEIGERLQIAKAQMTQLIDKLVNLNLVERKPDTADRRTLNITLTGNGRRIMEEHKNSILSAVRETMSRLTDEDLRDLSDSLRKLRSILLKLQ